MKTLRYLNPTIYAMLASQTLVETNGEPRGVEKRRFNIEVRKGCEAAIALALNVPGVYVNPEQAA